MCDHPDADSTVYVRERGKLRLVKGIVLKETKSVSSSCKGTKPLVLNKEHFKFTYNAEGSLRYSTKPLFDLCMTFIADNIHCVESLVGFPDQIGEKLFAASEEKRVFLEPDTAPRALQLFSDAYGDMILGSLCLRNRFALLSERIDEIKTFHSLKSLDLFGCGLGDSHDIFQHLTSGSLASLVQLFIGGNNLSDVGLQTLTAPIRIMRKRGLSRLQVLDLSYNPISERAIGYLACLPKVEKLDLSGAKLKLGTSLKSTLWDLMGLICSEQPLEIFDHSKCITEGWAEQVINQWEKNATQMPKQKEIGESRKSALHFFGRQKFVRDVLHAMPLAQEEMEEKDKQDRLQFCKPQENKAMTEMKLSGTTRFYNQLSRHGVKKRQRESQNNDSHSQHHSPPSKRFSSSTLTAEDMDLLDNY